MTHGKVRYFDFAVINAILVCLNLSKNFHTGIYYYSTCFICANISWQSELLLPQIICLVTDGFFVFCLVLVLLWSNEACRRNKQKYKCKNQPCAEAILLQLDMSHMRNEKQTYCWNCSHFHCTIPVYIYLIRVMPYGLQESLLLHSLTD